MKKGKAVGSVLKVTAVLITGAQPEIGGVPDMPSFAAARRVSDSLHSVLKKNISIFLHRAMDCIAGAHSCVFFLV